MKKQYCNVSRLLCALLCLGFAFAGCTEGLLGDNQKTEQGGDDNVGGQETPESEGLATVTIGKVTAATATFTGHINVAASDLSYAKVVVYYSDAETFNINGAKSISTFAFDKDQNFTIKLINLEYNTKYNYCIVAEVKSDKTYGEVLSFTTVNITMTDLVAKVKPFEADLSCEISGLSTEDKQYFRYRLRYSNDMENYEYADADEMTSDNVLSFSLPNLVPATTYYYRLEVTRTYVTTSVTTSGDYLSFTTLPPYDPYDADYNLPLSSATDLSLAASANCYIVSNAGLYKFKTVKGNSLESVGSVASASILWETFGTSETPAIFDVIKACCYKDGYIAFQTADIFKEGNAVIAAKDASGNILWSWHIWLTDQPQGQVYYNNSGTMMDRNLGATSAIPGDVGALGLLYQWGRKDPFLGPSSISSSTSAKSTITWFTSTPSNSISGTIAYATANPTTFIRRYQRSNYDWYYTGSSSTDNTRWTTSESKKSIYDPCPAGWRVPDGGDNGVWAKVLVSSEPYIDYPYDSANKGMNFSGKFGSASTIWYPASGYRYGGDDSFDDSLGVVGDYGYYWSASPNDYYAYGLYFSNGSVSPSDYDNRARGQSVRCLQE